MKWPLKAAFIGPEGAGRLEFGVRVILPALHVELPARIAHELVGEASLSAFRALGS